MAGEPRAVVGRGRGRIAAVALLAVLAACSAESEVSFFVVVKSSNWAQDGAGNLELLNYHFFSEIFLAPGGSVRSAWLERPEAGAVRMEYVDRGDNWYLEGGHFDSLEDLDAAYANGAYRFGLEKPGGRLEAVSLQLAGPGGRTDIPAPITISLEQEGAAVGPLALDASRPLVVRWSEYSNGRADPRGVVDDMIFVVIADCHGQRVFHTGLPFQGEYLAYGATEVRIDAGTLAAGQPYSAFVEFPHVVDSGVFDGIPGFTSYATATYLDLRTTGPASDATCPEVAPPMDTGQTDRGRR